MGYWSRGYQGSSVASADGVNEEEEGINMFGMIESNVGVAVGVGKGVDAGSVIGRGVAVDGNGSLG